MNGKKAKLLRRFAEQEGHYKLEPDYRVKKTKKMVYITNEQGIPTAQEVEKYTIINANRINFRRIKQAYKKGEIVI